MTQKEAYDVIRSCISPISICKIGFSYQKYEEFFFPLMLSNDLFLGIIERDFRLDGFTVRKLSEIVSAEPIRGTYLKIHQSEGTLNKLSVPPISIKSWSSVFSAISASGENVIVEGIAPDNVSRFFLIGKVIAAGEQGIRFRSFDGSGNWNERTQTVPYNNISSLTFGSSYITTYSKYVKPYPEVRAQRPQNR